MFVRWASTYPKGTTSALLHFYFPLGRDEFGIKTRCYITSLTLSRLPGALRIKYDDFINEGSLMILDGTVLDMMDVYEDLEGYIDEMQYDVRSVGFDPYNAQEVYSKMGKRKWSICNRESHMVKVPKTESGSAWRTQRSFRKNVLLNI